MYKYIDWKWGVVFSELKRKCFAGALCSFVLTRMVDEDVSRFLEHIVHYVVVVITDIHFMSACVCVFVFVLFFFFTYARTDTHVIYACYSFKKKKHRYELTHHCVSFDDPNMYILFCFFEGSEEGTQRGQGCCQEWAEGGSLSCHAEGEECWECGPSSSKDEHHWHPNWRLPASPTTNCQK